ncbi:MAG: hypothetical protein KF893_08205 [Caldilineaceae bacterium]|nr:hypothetical protein [Caldilineaceae bacterium]
MTSGPRARPAFTSASIYNHPSGLLSFLYASEWHLQVGEQALPAVTLTPDLADPVTHIAVTVTDLGAPLLFEDRATVVEGVREGLKQLERCRIESLTELNLEGRWGVEWQCTFLAGDARCRRRGRLFFSGRYQYAVVLQGSTEARYAYWQGMFEWTMLTVATASFHLQSWTQSASR